MLSHLKGLVGLQVQVLSRVSSIGPPSLGIETHSEDTRLVPGKDKLRINCTIGAARNFARKYLQCLSPLPAANWYSSTSTRWLNASQKSRVFG